MSKFDSYVLHIEQPTLDKLNELRDLTYELRGRHVDFDRLIYLAVRGRITAIKYKIKMEGKHYE